MDWTLKIQIFLFVWNILLKFEKKHSCNSIPRKSIDYSISYLDVFILQKFDPIYLQAFTSIETIATLWYEIFPLKCSTPLRFYFSKFNFSFLHSYIHFFYHTRIHWSFMLNCSELQRFPVCTCFGLWNLFIFMASRHIDLT